MINEIKSGFSEGGIGGKVAEVFIALEQEALRALPARAAEALLTISDVARRAIEANPR